MSGILEFTVTGAKSFEVAVGAMAEALGDPRLVVRGMLRPTPCPGLTVDIVEEKFTLQGQAKAAFENEGATALRGRWTGYENEPKYEAQKLAQGGGSKIGVWRTSRRPLAKTFEQGDPDHIESITDKGWEWGSARSYAGRFHLGAPNQPYDNVPQPARPVVTLDEKFALEVARGYQRVVMGAVKMKNLPPSEVRVNL